LDKNSRLERQTYLPLQPAVCACYNFPPGLYWIAAIQSLEAFLTKRATAQPSKYDPSAPKVSRREQLRKERRSRSMRWNVLVLGILVVALAAVAWYVFAIQRPGPLPGELVIPDEGSAVYPTGQQIPYQHYPPSSGGHYADAAPWGFSSTPMPEGNYVTNLAHGGVVYLYYCPTACPDLEKQLKDFYSKAPPDKTYNTVRILISPYQRQLPTQIVALAWDHELDLPQFNQDLMLRWYLRFVDLGPAVQP
jgi:Protein of unknown function (DUF3105)